MKFKFIPKIKDYINKDYTNNHLLFYKYHPMKFYNREDELQELNLLRDAVLSMIVLTGRRRVGKTEFALTKCAFSKTVP